MKKRILNILLLLPCSLLAGAQTVSLGPLHSADSPREDWLLPGDTICQAGQRMVYQGKPMQNKKYTVTSTALSSDAIALPNAQEEKVLDKSFYKNPVSDLTYSLEPTYGYGLHKGLNVSVGASAFATFGKGAPHKGGFSQNINATYLAPLTKDGKLWIAGGGYFNNTFYGGDSYRDVGLYAIMGYKFNEHWEAYVYGQLSVSNNYYPLYYYPLYAGTMPMGYGMGTPGANVIGAGAKYNVNKSFSIGINIEGVWYNNKGFEYFDRYNYPVGK